MTTPPAMPMRIGAIGMDQRQRNALRMLFSSKCDNRYLLVEEASAELCILDLDAFGGERLWQEFRQRHPEEPLILVSLRTQTLADNHTLFVRKPILVNQLIEAIEQQRSQLFACLADPPNELTDPAPPAPVRPPTTIQHQHKPAARKAASIMSTTAEHVFVGTAPDIDPQDPRQTAKIYYNPDHYLQGHLQHALNLAVRHNRNVTVDGPWPKLDLFIEQRRIQVAVNERHLRPYCTLPDATLGTDLQLFDGEEKPMMNGGQTYPLAAFFWKLALWASRGRLPEGTSLTQPIYLRRWPNFPRLVVTPYALAIAALWAEQPRSLIDTAVDLKIPQRYVFAFYSAARSLQLAGETRRAVDTLIAPPEIVQTKQRGLFGRLLDRLRGDAPG